jgi:ribosomal-protein-alanine N-acetyltransferase
VGVGSPPTIETQRLLLRQWRESDKAPYAALNADPAVMEHFPRALTTEQSDEMVDVMAARIEGDGYGLWATEVKATGAFIGFIGLNAPRFETAFTPCVEIGWRLAQHAWGNGYAPEGATAVLRFGFEHVAVPNDEIVSFTTVANTKSRRVMEKIGLVRDPSRDFDHPNLADWSGRHHVLYATTRERWLESVRSIT